MRLAHFGIFIQVIRFLNGPIKDEMLFYYIPPVAKYRQWLSSKYV